MAALQGTGGNFAATNCTAKFNRWTAAIQVDEVNTTGFGDLGWKNGKLTNARLVGTAIGTLVDTAGPVPSGALAATFGVATMEIAALVLTFASGKTWTFAANVTAAEIDRTEEGASVVRFSFASTGAITQAWA